jgi:hypothetical protein
MFDTPSSDTALWAATLARIRRELAALPVGERRRLAVQVDRIGALQTELDGLFRELDGPALCSGCLGGCCGQGKHHVTLTNLLGYLLSGEEPPEPDFAKTCPMLGAQGCRLPSAHRPLNCIVFLCDEVDRHLIPGQRDRFVSIEAELRRTYHEIAKCCPGASLRGLLIAAARLGDRPLLTSSERD